MKAGILTFHYAHHYGAQLQAYALMRAIQLLGVDCEIINYVRKDNIEGSSLFKKGLSPRSVLSNLDTLLHYRSLKKRHDRFDSFVYNEMKLSGKFYGSYKELCNDPPAYDVYVCGSDQVWNPLIFSEKTYDPAFFADFARSGRRVAYAPSFGISSIPDDKRDELAGYLSKFDFLSSRERQGGKIIREITGRETATVLDPTLLLPAEEWSRLAAVPGSAGYDRPEADRGDSRETGESGPRDGGYILCYFITDARKYSDYVGLVAEKYGLPVVSLCGSRRVVPQTKLKRLDCGPREFLGLFRGASVVCTDSFHGTVFSLIFEKEFYSFEAARDPSKAVGSRQYNLLETAGLLSRLYHLSSGVDGFRRLLDEQAGAGGHMPGTNGAQRHADSCRGHSYTQQGHVDSHLEHVDNHQVNANNHPKHADNCQPHAVNKETGGQHGAIDYRKVREILREKREESLSYLKNALVPGGEMDASSEENAEGSEIAETEA